MNYATIPLEEVGVFLQDFAKYVREQKCRFCGGERTVEPEVSFRTSGMMEIRLQCKNCHVPFCKAIAVIEDQRSSVIDTMKEAYERGYLHED